MTRRELGLALLSPLLVRQPRAFTLTGRLTATESERSERIASFGKAFAWFVNDAALWAQIEGVLDQEVTIRVGVRE